MAFSLSDRIGSGRIKVDPGAGWRGNTADYPNSGASASDRGAFGAEQDPSFSSGQPVMSSSLPGNPHSSAGFRRALEHTARTGNKSLSSAISKSDFSMGKNRKPSYFGQGARRHGMHIGSGAPPITPAVQEGADTGV